MTAAIEIGLNAVIVAVTAEEPRLLAVHRPGEVGSGSELALPSGPLDPEKDRTLELALGAWVQGEGDVLRTELQVVDTISLDEGGRVQLRALFSAVRDDSEPEPVLDWRFVALVA